MSPFETRRLTRRQWLGISLAGAGHAVTTARQGLAGTTGQKSPRWGAQLYTVRDQIARDPAATLEAIARIGYLELEILQPTLPRVGPLAKKLGLAIVSAHLDGPTSMGDGLGAFIDQARDFGVRFLVVPWVPPNERPTDRAGFESLAGRLNRLGEQASRGGMRLAYHNHAFEFGRDAGGARWLDVLMKAADPSLVSLELDVFWVSVAGANPIDLIERYSGRITLMHLKDRAAGLATTLREEQVPRSAFLEVGSGALDVPAILSAARAAGVGHFFVEQDFTPGDPVLSLGQSFAYLAKVGGGRH